MATSAENEPEPTTDVAVEAADDLKAKFKAALDRKHGHEAAGAPHLAGGSGTPHISDKRQRQFRRKSG
jgi:hypothetical protein